MVAPGVIHEVWRIGGHEGRAVLAEEPCDVARVRRIAAEQAMIAQQPQLATLRHGCAPRAFQRLVGVKIGHGFTREVRARLGGREGCTHIVEMLQQVATVAFQTTVSERARALRKQQKAEAAKQAPPEATADPAQTEAKAPDKPRRPPIVVNTCHAWSSDGPLVKRGLIASPQEARDAAAKAIDMETVIDPATLK